MVQPTWTQNAESPTISSMSKADRESGPSRSREDWHTSPAEHFVNSAASWPTVRRTREQIVDESRPDRAISFFDIIARHCLQI